MEIAGVKLPIASRSRAEGIGVRRNRAWLPGTLRPPPATATPARAESRDRPLPLHSGPGLPPRVHTRQTQILPELCPQLQGCGGRWEEAWPSSSPVELPRAVVVTFPLGNPRPDQVQVALPGSAGDCNVIAHATPTAATGRKWAGRGRRVGARGCRRAGMERSVEGRALPCCFPVGSLLSFTLFC